MAALTPAPSTKRQSRRDSESTLILPSFIPTMQPTLVDDPPAGDDWRSEEVDVSNEFREAVASVYDEMG